MDMIRDYSISLYQIYNSCDPYLRPIRSAASELQARTYPIIMPYLNQAAVLAQDSPGIFSVGVLLLFVLIALQVLNMIRRIMMWWIRLVWWVTISSVIILLAAAVWERGPEKAVTDVIGWGQQLSEVWWQEYRKWDGYQKTHHTSIKGTWS